MARDLVVLLGAGASVNAELPTMKRLVETFREDLSGRRRTQLEAIEGLLAASWERQTPARTVDIELIFEALDALSRSDAVLSAFVKPKGWVTGVNTLRNAAGELRQSLYEHVRKALDVDTCKVGYFAPLVELGREEGGLDLFSLNYDVAGEVACEHAGIPYTDGFDASCNPRLLDDTQRFPIRLHKLHGSLRWYHTGHWPLKVPVRPGTFPMDGADIGGQRLKEVMIYPGPGKALYAEPYADLMERFRARLREARHLVIVGCSLRDVHVRQAILEAMQHNAELRLAVVDPSAADVVTTSDALFPTSLQFNSYAPRISFLAQKAQEAFEGKSIVEHVRSSTQTAEALAKFRRARRVGGEGDVVNATRTALGTAISCSQWGTVSALRQECSQPIMNRVWEEYVQGARRLESPGFWLALVAAGSRDHSPVDRRVVRDCARELFAFAWEGGAKRQPVIDPRPEVLLPATLSDAELVVELRRRVARVQDVRQAIWRFEREGAYFFGPSLRVALTRLADQAAAVDGYLTLLVEGLTRAGLNIGGTDCVVFKSSIDPHAESEVSARLVPGAGRVFDG